MVYQRYDGFKKVDLKLFFRCEKRMQEENVNMKQNNIAFFS